MTHLSVETMIGLIAPSLGGVHKPVNVKPLKEMFENREYARLVWTIQQSMRLNTKLTLGIVRSGGPKKVARAAAWIEIPRPVPAYGTPSFENMRSTIFIREHFLKTAPFATIAFAIAHEMAHIVLYAIGHPLSKDERAVDTAAMILGYAEVYVDGKSYSVKSQTIEAVPVTGPSTWFGRALSWLRDREHTQTFDFGYASRTHTTGYLSTYEARHACSLIKAMR